MAAALVEVAHGVQRLGQQPKRSCLQLHAAHATAARRRPQHTAGEDRRPPTPPADPTRARPPCRGGSPAGAAMWCSYFFPDDQVHLNDFYQRATDSTRQFWTLPQLPAPRYPVRPVYVLTSATTFSGGEDVAYTLQALGRAELVGETTGGGAHPTERYPVTAHITVTVPTARTINAVTGSNWEGVGVRPDRAVPADKALETAHREAIRRLA
ncbi:S41 family peptidase [Streptomyces sp. NPDC127097]|uniref:S41 family peptidase n=1 Tax=Streptomyces sp. NPDC127097 TaxID=3347136 RepID=UPI00364DA0EB